MIAFVSPFKRPVNRVFRMFGIRLADAPVAEPRLMHVHGGNDHAVAALRVGLGFPVSNYGNPYDYGSSEYRRVQVQDDRK